MLKSELKKIVRAELLSICDNVEENFTHPQRRSEEQLEFPYITVVYGAWTPQANTKYGTQSISVIGIVKCDDEDLDEKASILETKLINKIYRNENFKCQLVSINNSNLFRPFGIDAGVFPPYAGFRAELNISNISVVL